MKLTLEEKRSWLDKAQEAARAAGLAIMAVYNSGLFEEESKKDQSPLTKADRLAHLEITKRLEASGLPVLSEEGRDIPYQERKQWESFWMVDPLDGTKEFIKRNGEFTVNIALIEGGKPVMGVIYIPVYEVMFWSFPGDGAFKMENGHAVCLEAADFRFNDEGLYVVGSRSHLNEATQEFISSLQQPKLISLGSSLKFMLLAQGRAQIYPRLAPTMEWDTAAAQAILEEAGGKVVEHGSYQPLQYNKENLLNPSFLATGNLLDWENLS